MSLVQERGLKESTKPSGTFTKSHIVHRGRTIMTPAKTYHGYVVGSVLRGLMNQNDNCTLGFMPDISLRLAGKKGLRPHLRLLFEYCEIEAFGVIKVVVLPKGLPNLPEFHKTFYFNPNPSVLMTPGKEARITSLVIGYPRFESVRSIDNTHLGTRTTFFTDGSSTMIDLVPRVPRGKNKSN